MGKAKRSGGGRGGQQQTEWKESEAEDTSMVPGREGGADDDVNEEIERKKQEYFKRKREEKKTATVLGGDEDTSFPAIQVKRSRLAADDGELSDVDVAGEEANPEEQAKEYHGIEIMPFNMREEQEEGHVTEAGDFVYDADKKDKDEREDGWIDDFEGRHGEEAENEMKRLRKRKEEQEKELLDKLQEEEQALSSVDVEAVVVELISFMQEGETVPRALSRVGGQQQQKRWKNTNKKKQEK
uniref:Uncharacterized protein n=1 Tax=Palpitomonas bilix TaxID=652834 RepID=A0A7S3DH84_9EUKA